MVKSDPILLSAMMGSLLPSVFMRCGFETWSFLPPFYNIEVKMENMALAPMHS
jgi:hypothetical protein